MTYTFDPDPPPWPKLDPEHARNHPARMRDVRPICPLCARPVREPGKWRHHDCVDRPTVEQARTELRAMRAKYTPKESHHEPAPE